MRFSTIAGILFVACATTAYADTFNFSYAAPGPGNGYRGEGTLTATATGTPGEYEVTGISGYANGYAIAELLPAGTFPTNAMFANDNLLRFDSTAPYFDVAGIAFRTLAGVNFDLRAFVQPNGPGLYSILSGTGSTSTGGAGLTMVNVTADTPEPSSLALLATGVIGVVGAVRRRLAA